MPQFDLLPGVVTEIVPAGSSAAQQITVSIGEALVFVGTRNPVKVGGAEGRTVFAPAGVAVSVRPVGVRTVLATGSATPATTPTPTPGDLVSPAAYTVPARTLRYALQTANAPVASWAIAPGLDGHLFTIDATTGILSPKDQTVTDLAGISAPITKQVRVRALLASGGAVEPVQPRSFTFTPIAAAMAAGEAFASDFTGAAGTALETLPGWTLYQRGTPSARPTPVRAGGGRLKGRPDSGDAAQWAVLRAFTDAAGGKTFRLTGIDMSVQGRVGLCLLADAALDNGVYVGFEAQPGTPGYTVVNFVAVRQGGTFSTSKVTLEPGPVYIVGRPGDNTIDLICTVNAGATQMVVYANGRLGNTDGAVGTYKVATIDLIGLTLGKLYGFGSSDGFVPLGANISVGSLIMETGSTATLTVTDAPTYSRTNVARYRLAYAGAAAKPLGLQHRFALILGGYTPWITGEAVVTGAKSGTIEYLADAPGAGEYGAPEFRLYDDIATRATAPNPVFMLSTMPAFHIGGAITGMIDFYGTVFLNDWGKIARIDPGTGTLFPPRWDINGRHTLTTNASAGTIQQVPAGISVVSSSAGTHVIDVTANRDGDAPIVFSGVLTSISVQRQGRATKIAQEAIDGWEPEWAWLRDLDPSGQNVVPAGTGKLARPLPTDARYTTNSGGLGYVVPWEDIVDYAAALAAAKPGFKGVWSVLGTDLTDTEHTQRLTYFRDHTPATLGLILEYGNEKVWNVDFSGVRRIIREGVQNGYWGSGTYGNPKPAKTVTYAGHQYDPFPAPAASTGDWVLYELGIYEAKRNVGAGSTIGENADWTLRSDIDTIVAGRRQAAVRHMQIIQIAKSVFGADYAKRVFPVLLGQQATDLPTQMAEERTFVPGYFDEIWGWGAAWYYSTLADDLGVNPTEDQLHASLMAHAPAIRQQIKASAVAALRARKVPTFYEGPLHVPKNFTAALQAVWASYFQSARGRAFLAMITRWTREDVPGLGMLFVAVGQRSYGYKEYFGDSGNQRWLGVKDGLAA